MATKSAVLCHNTFLFKKIIFWQNISHDNHSLLYFRPFQKILTQLIQYRTEKPAETNDVGARSRDLTVI